MECIQDLLPNEHILDFYSGVTALPPWLGSDLKLIVGAGDLDQEGLNLQQFSMFDVFFCEPWDNKGSLRKNIDFLLTNYYHQKVICFLNIHASEHLEQFCKVFQDRFMLIDGYGGHTPHLSLGDIAKTLKLGGSAINIYELYENVFFEHDLIRLCTTPTESLTKRDAGIFFATFQLYIVEDPVQKTMIISRYTEYLVNHAWKLSKTHPIQVDWSMLATLDIDEKMNAIKNLIGVLLHYDSLPKSLRGKFQRIQRSWNPEYETYELILTKIDNEE